MVLLWQGKKNLMVCQIFRGSQTYGLELYNHGKRSLKIAFYNIGYSMAQGILFAIQNKFEFSTAKKTHGPCNANPISAVKSSQVFVTIPQ
jgi:hypothetical protein